MEEVGIEQDAHNVITVGTNTMTEKVGWYEGYYGALPWPGDREGFPVKSHLSSNLMQQKLG